MHSPDSKYALTDVGKAAEKKNTIELKSLSKHHTSFIDTHTHTHKRRCKTQNRNDENQRERKMNRMKQGVFLPPGIFLVYYLLLKFTMCHYNLRHVVFMNI